MGEEVWKERARCVIRGVDWIGGEKGFCVS